MPAGDPGGHMADTGGYGGNYGGVGGAARNAGGSGSEHGGLGYGGMSPGGFNSTTYNLNKLGYGGPGSGVPGFGARVAAYAAARRARERQAKRSKSDKSAGLSWGGVKRSPITGTPLPALPSTYDISWYSGVPEYTNINDPDAVIQGLSPEDWNSGLGWGWAGPKDQDQISPGGTNSFGGNTGWNSGSSMNKNMSTKDQSRIGWADGGLIQPGQVGLVGERGPELAQGTSMGTQITPMPGQAPVGITAPQPDGSIMQNFSGMPKPNWQNMPNMSTMPNMPNMSTRPSREEMMARFREQYPNMPGMQGMPPNRQFPNDFAALIAQHQAAKQNRPPITPPNIPPNIAALIAQHQANKPQIPNMPPRPHMQQMPPRPQYQPQPITNRQINGWSGISARPEFYGAG